MSFTGVFTECKNDEGTPIIKDLDGLKAALKEKFKYGDTLCRLMQTEKEIKGGYPRQEYEAFLGFRTWKEDVVELHNLERIGYGYNKSHEWAEIFALVSKFTEPFHVFHSPDENRFPFLPDYLEEDAVIFKATCESGKCVMEEIRFAVPTSKIVERLGT